jgi:phospholipid/cholesterol/gamma-HCH transport system substrate-binding protein
MSWRSQRERARINPAVMGAFVLIASLLLFYVAASRELPFTGGHELRIQFGTANQIAPNAPVRIAGVNVGDVKGIDRGPGDSAMVTVELKDEALPVHSDATARIRPRTFLEGAFFVDIEPGSPSAPEIEDGGVIPMGQTSTPVQLDQILTGLQPDVREQLRVGVQELAKGLDDGGPEAFRNTLPVFEPLFKKIAVTSEAFTGTEPHDLSRGIHFASRASRALAKDRPRLASLVQSFSTVAVTLSDRQSEVAATIRGLDTLLGEAPPAFEAIDSAVPEARSLVRVLRPALRRAPRVINPTVPLTAQLRGLMRPWELPALIEEGAPTVRALANASPNGITTFGGLREPVGCLLDSALPTLTSSVDDDGLSTGEPVYRELLYSFTGLASASQNFDGNGFNTRYYAGGDSQVVSTPFGDPAAQLFGLAEEPILGSRPAKPAEAPPLRPDAPGSESDPPDLDAATGPSGFITTQAGGVPMVAPPVKTSAATDQALNALAEATP